MVAKGKEPSFEEALRALEEIVGRMESGDTRLEETIRLFEEGMRLSAVCQKRLDEADRKIDLILRRPAGIARESEDEEAILGPEEGTKDRDG